MSAPSQSLLRRDGATRSRRGAPTRTSRRAAPPIAPLQPPRAAPAALPERPVPQSTQRDPWAATGVSVLRYLPAAVAATLSVAILPAFLSDALISARGVGGTLATVACAVAISLLLAVSESTVWKRLHGVRGVVFSDLMLWSFARRLWAERRLKRIGAAYGAAVAGGGQARVELLEGLSRLLETRNPYTYGHCRRVARHAERIARAMRLTPAEVSEVRAAALIHDIGKVYTPAAILHKPGPLTDEEFEVVKRHAADGADMLAPVRDQRLAAIVRHHHERIDGSGYPDRLHGEEIPLAARIIAVADTFDAITSHRPYRRARSQKEGLAVLGADAGRVLDAAAVNAFLDVYTPRRSVASISLSAAVWARLAPIQFLPSSLFGGASLAGLLPAVGAAGLLAVSPDARYERVAAEPSGGATAALQSAFPGALGTRRRAVPLRVSSGSPVALVRAPGGRRLAVRAPSGPPTAVSGTPAPAAPVLPSGSSSTGSAPSPGSTPAGAAPATPAKPRVSTPSVSTPALTVPTATAPSVTTPAVAVGPVKVGPVSTPAVETPPVSIPGVTVPGG